MKKKEKYGAIKVINCWFDLVPEIFKQWRIFMCYATVFTVLSAVLNRWTYACHGKLTGYWCHWYVDNSIVLIGAAVVFYLIALLLLASFGSEFFKQLQKNSVFKAKDIIMITSQKLKSMAVIMAFFGVIICAVALFAYILNRPANPDWRAEFIWFVILFSSFVTVLLIMRCFSGMAYYFNEKNIPFCKIYKLTEGHAYVGIFSFLVLVMICSSFNLSTMRYFGRLMENHNYLITAVLTDFLDCVAKLFYFSLFLILSQAEYLSLKEEQKDEKASEETLTDTSKNAELATKNIRKKSEKKKKIQRKIKTRNQSVKLEKNNENS